MQFHIGKHFALAQKFLLRRIKAKPRRGSLNKPQPRTNEGSIPLIASLIANDGPRACSPRCTNDRTRDTFVGPLSWGTRSKNCRPTTRQGYHQEAMGGGKRFERTESFHHGNLRETG
jgi:hypothetical protein